ncbi:hypothetical protein [Chryseobacterium sp. ERMR1:04]|uniref:hypothetical protein n=1 Tax=Chryseobacterium sp. ERMR1:04 TaxID=1705393 RepID=UPI0006C88F0D|nr:hypothetical protein [Chryseobacterium sp. ERMR1:04]KPH10860.1 hypothetical protein AMQ68_23645 [Chryseobacterium sp. ERMR1:04]
MKKHLISAFAVAAMAFFAVSSGSDKKEGDAAKTETKAGEEKKDNWTYTQDEDKMEGTKYDFAKAESTNKVELKFPYDGGITAGITLRNNGKESEAMLTLSKGRFMTSIGGNKTVKVKFDDQPAKEYTYGSPNDGSGNVIFLDNSKDFIKKIKDSKKAMLEVTFFQEGAQIFEFNTEGLKWDK